MKTLHLRILYAALSAVLLVMEIVIGLFVHDRFIRPFFGDVLVVILIGCILRIIWPRKIRLLAFYVFLFACAVEFLQKIGIVEILGLQDHAFLRVLIGTSFDWRDILCYAVGCVMFVGMEFSVRLRLKKSECMRLRGGSDSHNKKS